MKKNVVIFLFLINIFLVRSQVGIFTENPQSIFHIDVLKNNPADQPPTKDQSKDDVVIQKSQGGINMSIGTISKAESSAQLELGGTKSAFIPNKVSLASTTDITTVPNPIDGMLLYNTTDDSAVDLYPSLYSFQGGMWNRLYSRDIISTIEVRDLFGRSSTTQGNVAPQANSQAYQNATFSTPMYWKDPNDLSAQATNLITIPETGAYAFTVRLYGEQNSAAGSSGARTVLYLWLLKDGISSADNVLDGSEVDVVTARGQRAYSYTLTLAATLTAGDKVGFAVGTPTTTGFTANNLISKPRTSEGASPLPNRTSLIFWKL